PVRWPRGSRRLGYPSRRGRDGGTLRPLRPAPQGTSSNHRMVCETQLHPGRSELGNLRALDGRMQHGPVENSYRCLLSVEAGRGVIGSLTERCRRRLCSWCDFRQTVTPANVEAPVVGLVGDAVCAVAARAEV